jgi:hypothetical protein
VGNVISSIESHTVDTRNLVSPNPFTTEINLSLDLNASKNLRISLFNTLGQTISVINTTAEKGLNTFTINTLDLISGYYILTIHSEEMLPISIPLLKN